VDKRERPISIAMLALGGQGGGVLTGWLVDTAEANGYMAQSTYVAGVAQRTGATVYCVEMFPRESARVAGQLPVFTPYPIPGDVELVIAGEMAETGRAIE
jgi:indolepyruvate ferredoxin oxidoreductase beta subunit